MRVRRQLHLLLLLAPTCALTAGTEPANKVEAPVSKETLTKEEIFALNVAPRQPQDVIGPQKQLGTSTSSGSPRPTQNKPYVGTDDAPVDGLDGKPHAGPWVDSTPDQTHTSKGVALTSSAKSEPTSLERLKQEIANIPDKNDGVMDDDSRPVPRPGTTGTEGGVSEKEKTKQLQGINAAENLPQTPKVQPPLPHSEQERIQEQKDKIDVKNTKDDEKSSKGDDAAKKGQQAAGGLGIEKPADLPDKPHNIPHPDPKNSNTPSGRDRTEPPSEEERSKWLQKTMPYTEGQAPRKPKKVKSGDSATGHDDSLEEWFHSFVVSLTMIIFTEIGDKTFLVAALMAMRHSRLVVFSAAFSALIAMTVLSAVLGHLAPTLLPKRLTTLAAAILFIIFGARMLREGLLMSKTAGVGEEMKEVEAELEEKEHDIARDASRKDNPYVLESGRKDDDYLESQHGHGGKRKKSGISGFANLLGLVLSPAWVQTFIMTFLGEWGDRSQIATIAMAAGQDYWWVTLGAILGHAFCTGLAVLGGRALAGRVSMRVVTIGGAAAFLFFGILYLVECYVES